MESNDVQVYSLQNDMRRGKIAHHYLKCARLNNGRIFRMDLREIRCLDKQIDELVKGTPLERIPRG